MSTLSSQEADEVQLSPAVVSTLKKPKKVTTKASSKNQGKSSSKASSNENTNSEENASSPTNVRSTKTVLREI